MMEAYQVLIFSAPLLLRVHKERKKERKQKETNTK
jgi:hypothetical protein